VTDTARLPLLKMVNHPLDNLQMILPEGTDSLINFALPIIFYEHLSLSGLVAGSGKSLRDNG
jgi:hypothetical protein